MCPGPYRCRKKEKRMLRRRAFGVRRGQSVREIPPPFRGFSATERAPGARTMGRMNSARHMLLTVPVQTPNEEDPSWTEDAWDDGNSQRMTVRSLVIRASTRDDEGHLSLIIRDCEITVVSPVGGVHSGRRPTESLGAM